jgi:hypothetical protein
MAAARQLMPAAGNGASAHVIVMAKGWPWWMDMEARLR